MATENAGIEKIFDADVLVIGGGGAALRAAVAAYDAGAKTTVVLKGQCGRSGATVSPDSAGVAWQAADDCSGEEDSPEVHFQNIIDAGLGMADPRLARILAYEILERTEELENWGLSFIPDPEGKKPHYTGYSCFGDQPRAHGIANSGWGHAGDIVRVLVEQIKRRDIEVHEDTFITDLIVQDGECVGALALGPDGELVAYRAGAVVVAAGGARQMFPQEPGRTRIDTTGDGYAIALRAGAELTNMEFTQYMLHPVSPFVVNVPGSFWTLFPVLRNRHGEDALAPYLPPGISREQVMVERTLHYPFSSRDTSRWLDVAIATEIREGRGTAEGGLYLDFSQVDLSTFQPSRPQHLPEDYSRPIELPESFLQIRPAAHAINGGIWIDERAATTLRGLFAVGEVAAGPHGADRLGGGMVTNCQVFGERAGRFAGERALQAGWRELTPECLELPLARLRGYGQGQRDAEDVLGALQQATGAGLMVTRNERSLQTLVDRIWELRAEWLPQVTVDDPRMLRRAVEVENSLLTAVLMARAALMRRESRGSHFREDYPRQDDENWRVNVIFRQEDGDLRDETKICFGINQR
jgi:succinate dehydrogenase/fumarate reductase flavoprotein subunit